MVDTSASRAIDYESRLQRLKDLINGLGGIGVERVQVIAYDQSSQEIFDGALAQSVLLKWPHSKHVQLWEVQV